MKNPFAFEILSRSYNKVTITRTKVSIMRK